ncbi:cytochrome C [Sulfuricaulis limicola]|uniref:Cytochrome C n=1 Tax=Sulfuricaulis limicola TaxID=1620215 RepID=A0A1B4XIQ3_9GAMM|nr:PKD domain-containing protein [Sulfuricaulis limicola]BAV34682.1 cytochrome C [Sulfuricaulis limicola]
MNPATHRVPPALAVVLMLLLPLSSAWAAQPAPLTCGVSASVTTIPVGGIITYTGTAAGGVKPYRFDFTFSGGSPTSNTQSGNSSGTSAPVPVTYNAAGSYTTSFKVTDSTARRPKTCTATVNVTVNAVSTGTSINSTSQIFSDVFGPGILPGSVPPVTEQAAPRPANSLNPAPGTGTTGFQIVAINDLGMHCGDYDTRISSILPPFQVLLAQVIQKGAQPVILNSSVVDVLYSAASNPEDPILGQTNPDPFTGVVRNNSTVVDIYKTNFWKIIPKGAYDPFYPAFNPFNPAQNITPLAGPPFTVTPDESLPVPNVKDLFIGPDGVVNSGDEFLSAVQHNMPGITSPFTANLSQTANEHYEVKPFFVNFPFGYVAQNLNWFEAAGVPFAAWDDKGRENAYPLVRVQAKTKSGGAVLATVDTVLPISGEASCKNCHAAAADVPDSPTKGVATAGLTSAGLPVADRLADPEIVVVPENVSIEYATDINVLRLHDLRHGSRYVNTSGQSAACVINSTTPNGNANCLINKALVQDKPVVCQVCHYTPALDLAHLGPLAGAVGTIANGRNQIAHPSNSRVMHWHHGNLDTSGRSPGDTGYNANSLLFPNMPLPIQDANGIVTNQAARVAVLDAACYQCHPGKTTKCLRGVMRTGNILCNDCHGSMKQVGDDFSRNVSPSNPGAFILAKDFYTNPATPRVPWANEPGCGSCHSGDAVSNLANTTNVIKNTKDATGVSDNIRLRVAFRTNDTKATPIVPANKRFAEPLVPAAYNGFVNPGAGNPQLYRVSTGHGGVMCEGCHGATHAEWPMGNPRANDNRTAEQIQGHDGKIQECDACHTRDANGDLTMPLGLDGPHGLHPVNDHRWNLNHKNFTGGALANCKICHMNPVTGALTGSVLSKTSADRVVTCKNTQGIAPYNTDCADGTATIAKGTPVGCGFCHKQK